MWALLDVPRALIMVRTCASLQGTLHQTKVGPLHCTVYDLIWDEVNTARVRLLEILNDRLKPLTALDPLTELAGAGLTSGNWLAAVELQRRIIGALLRIDP
ncbi:MAG: hypothetical protein C0467_17540 [Planctomycetaceae bacterium]|nr:hypothetical protein [Planctomycetaceae bacterium]